jgi:hypothetical protein
MRFNWDSVIQGIAIGVAASSILAAFSLSRDAIRNLVFKIRLRREFRWLSFGTGLDGVSIGVRNHLGKAFTVREFVMIADKRDYRLNPTDEVISSFKGQYPKLSRKQRRMLKKGKISSIPLSSEIQFRPWRSEKTREGFVVVQPFTSHKFLLPAELIPDFNGTISGFRVTVEYDSWPRGSVKIVQVQTRESIDQVRNVVQQYREQILSGSLNAARAAFGKPPVTAKSKTRDHQPQQSK